MSSTRKFVPPKSRARKRPFSARGGRRLAWRSTAGRYDCFDARALREALESGVQDLKCIFDSHEKKAERLEMVCREEEKRLWLSVAHAQDSTRRSAQAFEALDARLGAVSAKVVYLGDQLEGVNTPRARAVEAQTLIRRFARFLTEDAAEDMDDLEATADVVQKLQLIATELPVGVRFDVARRLIGDKYDAIERQLIEAFVAAQREDDRARMRQVAATLAHFKGFSQCVDAFIETSVSSLSSSAHVFQEIPALCARTETLVRHVFPAPDHVMSKFVLNIFHGRLQESVSQQLAQFGDARDDRYLHKLHTLFANTSTLAQQLAASLAMDAAFLARLSRHVFARHLEDYVAVETQCLREKCQQLLRRYYESKNHQKRPHASIGTVLGFELKRDLQQRAKPSDESFVCEEVAITVLQETKLALQRCRALSARPQDIAATALRLFELQMHFLFAEHLDYGVDLALQSIPALDSKSAPEVHFLEVTRQCNAICHLADKQFIDSVLPLVANTAKHGECLNKKREITQQLQLRLNTGLERSLAVIVGWVRALLSSEQKKTDFKPETEVVMASRTAASVKVIKFVDAYVQRARDSLDGNNVLAFLQELGLRFHRALFDHFQQFQFSTAGAMTAICDLNEYRDCIARFQIPLLAQLFAALHALFNLLIVAPENLKHAMEEVALERSLLLSFIQLRVDYKTAKLQLK
ncbi:unnamed protein product [Medioppia subpectinata]|uniref:Exocyst complex component 5 n=1 Tax=Medioppia subpectinata TaxID=1979941 RepID=A0A7R9KC67_9ACAR|nr:unnamed protein product [Medioppia subpectinata]CAG2100785.1 unnamed protein product [Medioppia subpectinata]